MAFRRRAVWLAAFVLLAAVCFAQQHGEAPAGKHAEAPLVLFGKWHVPPLLVELLHWTNFLVLFGLLGWLLRRPIADFFAARSRAIQEGLESGRRAGEEAAQRAQEIERRLAGLESEIAKLRAAISHEGQAEFERLRRAAQAETEKVFASAEQEIRALARAARGDLKSYVAVLAVELAEQRIRARMTPQKQAELVRVYAGDLGNKPV